MGIVDLKQMSAHADLLHPALSETQVSNDLKEQDVGRGGHKHPFSGVKRLVWPP